VFASPLQNGDEVILGLGSGDEQHFVKTSSTCNAVGGTTSYTPATTPPAGIDVDLCKQTNGSLTYTDHASQEVITFNSAGQEVTDADRNGNATTFAYNSDGTTNTITDPEGRLTNFTYAAEQLQKITDSAGRSYNYGYTGTQLTSYTDALGKVTTYAYDSSNNMTQVTDPDGHVTQVTYDTDDSSIEVSTVTIGFGSTVASTTTYDEKGRDTSVSGGFANTTLTDPNNNTTTYVWDYPNQVLKTTDALGHARAGSYSPDANPSALTDGLSAVSTLSYDTNNNLNQIQAPLSPGSTTNASSFGSYATPAMGVGAAASAACPVGSIWCLRQRIPRTTVARSATTPTGTRLIPTTAWPLRHTTAMGQPAPTTRWPPIRVTALPSAGAFPGPSVR
jgi:YD repeat-containing protein